MGSYQDDEGASGDQKAGNLSKVENKLVEIIIGKISCAIIIKV